MRSHGFIYSKIVKQISRKYKQILLQAIIEALYEYTVHLFLFCVYISLSVLHLSHLNLLANHLQNDIYHYLGMLQYLYLPKYIFNNNNNNIYT